MNNIVHSSYNKDYDTRKAKLKIEILKVSI